jgi:hypothetical protein
VRHVASEVASEHTPGPNGYDAELRRHNEVLRRACGIQLQDPLEKSRYPGAHADPHGRPASASVAAQRTGLFLRSCPRGEGTREKPYGSRIRHEDEKSASAILMRTLQGRR